MIYPYFICAGRHSKRTNCERKAMYVPDIEAAVEEFYRTIEIPEHIVTALRELIIAEFARLSLGTPSAVFEALDSPRASGETVRALLDGISAR